jgi:ComF family protein
MKSAVKVAADSLFSVLFPSDCRICSSPLVAISMLPVCQLCMEKVVPLEGLLCCICSEKLFTRFIQDEGEGGAICGLCRRVQPEFRRAVAYGAYDGPLRDLIHLFKYQGVRPAGQVLAQLLQRAIAQLVLPEPLLLIPVPLWTGKHKARGFNQAEAIARAFLGAQKPGSIQLDTTTLVRRRETASQTGLTRKQRRANVRGAFAVGGKERIRGRSILLIDDVMTTGTTVNECARVLRRAGAKEIYVATVARATKEVESVALAAAGVHGGN